MLSRPPMPQAVLPPAKAMVLHKCCQVGTATGCEYQLLLCFPAHTELLCSPAERSPSQGSAQQNPLQAVWYQGQGIYPDYQEWINI